ncbi:MAG: GFA family protein [Parvularculaceae bacterium]
MTAKSWKQGGCHCGAVEWEVETGDAVEVVDCNCSICRMTGFLHLIVPKSRFLLIRGEDRLKEYRFGTGVARHLFCKVCGVKSFYVPRSNPDGVSVNLRCMDRAQFRSVESRPIDGVNWEKNAPALANLSREDD